ncbi:transglutaminase N-terminal domain-containing protein [Algoriphagus namhaensis]|uniref:Transglutaminase N-terminal domain-containing protein n=1 Tax=Algoriphagus namhaensis TaxID=915353 RepID=A0ABV8AU47_9BACT
MKLAIQHLTRYTYGGPVVLGMHKLFLVPQYRSFQKVLKRDLIISPIPQGKAVRTDMVGNSFDLVWFDQPCSELEIRSDLLISCQEFNPFAFIIDPEFILTYDQNSSGLFSYSDETVELISAYVHSEIGDNGKQIAKEFFSKASDLLSFLVDLTSYVHTDWEHLIREEENLWTAEKTFKSKTGSCRDLAWMQMNLLGTLGLASRFVSGYAFNPELSTGHELHAWLEVYLPGAGWVGMDPSLGLLTDHSYVPLAFHPRPENTLPVQGKYGGQTDSKLFTEVSIQKVGD